MNTANEEKRSLTTAKQALRLFSHPLASRSQAHHNARQWLRSVSLLGPKWLLAENIKLVRRN